MEIFGINLFDFFSDIKEERVIFFKDDMFEKDDDELKYFLMWLILNV